MNELEAMETFVRVVDSGSFSAAAQTLGAAQPTISRRIAALEAHLGAGLLVRTTRSVRLTSVGERYLDKSRRALAAIEDARRTARAGRDAAAGRLRVSAPISFGTAWLAPRLPAFMAAHPRVELQLQLADRFEDLSREAADVGLRIGGPNTAELRGKRLATVRRHVVASPGWLSRNGGAHPDVQALEGAAALVFPPDSAFHGWQVQVGEDVQTLLPRPVLSAGNGDFLRVLALRGEGLALLPRWIVAEDLARGTLVRLFDEATEAARELWVVWPARQYVSEASRAFRRWVQVELSTKAAGAVV